MVTPDQCPAIRDLEGGIVVPIPSDIDTPQPLNTGVLTRELAHVAESITWRGGNRWTFDPRIPDPQDIRQMEGRYLFAGLLYGHFGHFLVESTARLWAIDQLAGQLDGIVFVPKVQRRLEAVKDNYQPFFDLLGLDLPIYNLAEPTAFEHLYVPPQGFGMFGMIQGLPVYRDFMRGRLAKTIGEGGSRKIYISRSDLTHQRGGILGEVRLEAFLAEQGYQIFHPQNHSFEAQLQAYKSADYIISPDGSPLHMAALVARPGTKVAVIARRPNIALQFRYQFSAFCQIDTLTVNALINHWIPETEDLPNRLSYGELDEAVVCDALATAGFVASSAQWPRMTEAERQEIMTVLESRQRGKFKLFIPAMVNSSP